MKHRKQPKHLDLFGSFPWHQYAQMRRNQKETLEIIEKAWDSRVPGQPLILVFEEPTGSGKTATGYTPLKGLERLGERPLFYITPTKAAIEEVKRQHPDVKVIFGRNEYDCLYYKEKVMADEVPCSMLDCPHRVNQETGETWEKGAEPCPYYLAKYQAKQGGIVVCTVAFYLLTQLFTHEWGTPAGLVVDEAHRIARMVRTCLSYEITDYHLKRAINFLERVDPKNAQLLKNFLDRMVKVIRLKPVSAPTLLEAWEIKELMDELIKVDSEEMARKVRTAVREMKIDLEEERETLKRLEILTRDLSRYYRSFEYSLTTPQRHSLNYTYAFYKKALGKRERVQYRLYVQAHYVAPLIQKILSPFTVAYSATIGKPRTFSFENGIKGSFYTFPSEFPTENTRIFMPTDTPNLAVKARSRGDLNKVMRRITAACKELSGAGVRSLVIVVSEAERKKFLRFSQDISLDVISYGNGTRAKKAVEEFKEGKGQVLVGTAANYGESIDLPKELAGVIFYLRPSYPRPNDPATIFEERRFGTMRWKVWTWRVMNDVLQARGRNIRSPEDLGVTIFPSQQFRRFLFAALPEWLKPAYKGNLTFKECIKEAKEVLTK